MIEAGFVFAESGHRDARYKIFRVLESYQPKQTGWFDAAAGICITVHTNHIPVYKKFKGRTLTGCNYRNL